MPKKKGNFKKGLRIFFSYLTSYKKDITFLIFLGIISALANGTVPFIVGSFFDAILESSKVFTGTSFDMPMWLFLLIIFALTQIIANIVDWINSKKSQELNMTLYTKYHSNTRSCLLRLPMGFHSSKKFGGLQDKINRGANAFDSILENTLLPLAPQFLSILVGFSISFYISIEIGLIFIFSVIIYVLLFKRISMPLDSLIRSGNKGWNKAFNIAFDAVNNIDSVKKYTTEDLESKKINNAFVNIAGKTWNKVNNLRADMDFYQRVVVAVTQILVFVVSVLLIQKGEMTIGELITLNGYSAMVFGPFIILAKQWQSVQNGLIDIEVVEKILNIPSEKYNPKNEIKLPKIKGDIEFRDVNFYYNKKDGNVLKNINFKVKSGETIALVGESGVGKSTLVELISAYYFAQKGNVLIDGIDIKKIGLNFLRKNIAVVSQEVILFDGPIIDNIKYGNEKATKDEVKKAAKDAYADKFITKFKKGYKQDVGYNGIKLSVGQKQRISIARAILRNPKILILDEPTSALDSKSEKFITESLKKLMKNKTTFIIAHRLSTVRHADKILVFQNGEIVENGSHKDLISIKNGVYSKLYKLHIGLK